MIKQEQIDYLRVALQKDSNIFGSNIIFSDTVQSTQDALIKIAGSASDGTIWLTRSQLSGRGRHGRVWLSPPGSLTFSVLIRPGIPAHKAGTLMMTSAVSLYSVLCRYTSAVSIKWPNDIMIDGKVAGIVIDTAISDVIQWAVIGVGVNVSIDTKDMPGIDTVSNHTTDASAYEILLGFLKELNRHHMNQYRDIQRIYKEECSTIGNMVHYGDVQGLATDIDKDGALLVQMEDNIKRVIIS